MMMSLKTMSQHVLIVMGRELGALLVVRGLRIAVLIMVHVNVVKGVYYEYEFTM